MGKEAGSQLGTVLDVGLYEFPENAKAVKVKIQFNIAHPIRVGMFIGNDSDGIKWVDFRYENLPMFCFGCGMVGHNQENFKNPPFPFEGGTNPRGAWHRSKSYGRRLIEKKVKTLSSNPIRSLSGGQFSPIPKGLMDKMAAMSLKKSASQLARQTYAPQSPQHTFTQTPNFYNSTPIKFQATAEDHQAIIHTSGTHIPSTNHKIKIKMAAIETLNATHGEEQSQVQNLAGLEVKANQES